AEAVTTDNVHILQLLLERNCIHERDPLFTEDPSQVEGLLESGIVVKRQEGLPGAGPGRLGYALTAVGKEVLGIPAVQDLLKRSRHATSEVLSEGK
ncbi:hypothetical protein KKF04_05240, partial [Patescibacteria group bacterium]|nr:hypothetical protein [Patescibacteria group bacterium]